MCRWSKIQNPSAPRTEPPHLKNHYWIVFHDPLLIWIKCRDWASASIEWGSRQASTIWKHFESWRDAFNEKMAQVHTKRRKIPDAFWNAKVAGLEVTPKKKLYVLYGLSVSDLSGLGTSLGLVFWVAGGSNKWSLRRICAQERSCTLRDVSGLREGLNKGSQRRIWAQKGSMDC